MPSRCCVVGCKYWKKPIHRFPVYEEEIFNVWKARVANPKLNTMTDLKIYQNLVICNDHFIADCNVIGSSRLKKFAVPSVRLPEFNEEPTIENSYHFPSYLHDKPANKLSVDLDHSYFPTDSDNSAYFTSQTIKENAVKEEKYYLKHIGCAAITCFNKREKQPNLQFLNFPIDADLALLWATNAGRRDLVARPNSISNRYFLCAEHFDVQYFKDESRNNELKDNVIPIPTIFPVLQKKSYYKGTRLISYNGTLISTDIAARENLSTYLDGGTTVDGNLSNDSSISAFGQLSYTDDLYEDFASNPVSTLEPTTVHQIIVKDYCRLCATKLPLTALIPMFSTGDATCYGEMLEKYLPGRFHREEALPKDVCSSCIAKLENCCKTLKGFVEADISLRKQFNKLIPKELKPPVDESLKNDEDITELISIEVEKNPIKMLSEDDIMEIDSNLDTIKPKPIKSTTPILPKIHKAPAALPQQELNPTDIKLKYQCITCQKIFNTKKQVIDHSKSEHPSPEQDKIVCKVITSNAEKKPEIVLPEERSRYRTQKIKFECLLCSTLHEKKETLIKHTQRYHSNVSKEKIVCRVVRAKTLKHNHVKCLRCNEKFKSIHKYQQHMQKHVNYSCKECGMSFNKMYKLKAHQKKHNPQIYICILCKMQFDNKSELLKHEAEHKKQLEDVTCATCKKRFTSAFELRKHEQVHESTLCSICGKLFSTSLNLYRHYKIHSNERPYSCKICSKSFKSISTLSKHKSVHTSERNFICQVCGKQFRTNDVLKQHMLCHAPVRPHACDICGATFHRRGNLTKHKITHFSLKDKHFQCKFCPEEFDSRVMYMRHKTKHVDEKESFSCPSCPKKFLTKFQMVIHSRHHTGETPFSCDICQKSFRSTALLKQHRLIHLDIFPHSCDFCERKFRRQQSLIVHRKTHTGERPFPCPICGRAFANRCDMMKHKRIHLRKKEYVPVKEDSNSKDSESSGEDRKEEEASTKILESLLKKNDTSD